MASGELWAPELCGYDAMGNSGGDAYCTRVSDRAIQLCREHLGYAPAVSSAPQAKPNRDRIPLAALMVLAVVLWIPWARGPIDLRWDAGVYYILGTSLAEGNGYRLLNEPGNPEAIQYPPLLPIFIASQERLLGTSDPVIVGKWLRLIYQLMLMGCAALTYLLARRWSSRWPAFLAGVIFLLSLHTYFMGSLAFSEVPFTLVSLLFFAPSRSTKLA